MKITVVSLNKDGNDEITYTITGASDTIIQILSPIANKLGIMKLEIEEVNE